MNNLNVLTTARLRTLIADTENTLKELTIELERRQSLKQEEAIEHLEEHMKGAEVSLSTIQKFLAFIINDLKDKK